MDSEKLRGLQAPLKAQYREDAGAAVITLSAEGRLDDILRWTYTRERA